MALTEVSRTRLNNAPFGPVEHLVWYDGANPAAGAEVSDAIPAGKAWRIQAIYVELVTDATVANRSIRVQFKNGATKLFEISDTGVYTASLTGKTSFVRGAHSKDNLLTGLHIVELFDIWLPPGTTIATLTGNLQAGDNYAALKYDVIEREVG